MMSHNRDLILVSGIPESSITNIPANPFFTYRVKQAGTEVGSIQFYKHPLLCRSDSGDRHNVIAVSGVFANVDIDAKTIDEVCAALPPTLFDRVAVNAQHGATTGLLRGVSNVAGYTLQARNVPPSITKYIRDAIYYGGYFMLHCHNRVAEEGFTVTAMLRAAADTGSLFAVNTAVSWVMQAARVVGAKAAQSGWSKMGGMFNFFANNGSYLVYAANARQHGVVETAAGLAAGAAAQLAVEQTYKTLSR